MRSLLVALSSQHKPWQVASAIAFGILAGSTVFSPPLLVVILAVLFLAPIHFPVAVAAAAVSAILQYQYGQALCAALGWRLVESLQTDQALLKWIPDGLYSWLGLAKVAVLGGLAIGFAQLPITFILTWLTLRARWGTSNRSEESPQYGVATDSKVLAASPRTNWPTSITSSYDVDLVQLEEAFDLEETTWHPSGEAPAPAGGEPVRDIGCPPRAPAETKVESFLATCSAEDVDRLTTMDVAHRAADLAAVLDELLESVTRETAQPTSDPSRAAQGFSAGSPAPISAPPLASPPLDLRWETEAAVDTDAGPPATRVPARDTASPGMGEFSTADATARTADTPEAADPGNRESSGAQAPDRLRVPEATGTTAALRAPSAPSGITTAGGESATAGDGPHEASGPAMLAKGSARAISAAAPLPKQTADEGRASPAWPRGRTNSIPKDFDESNAGSSVEAGPLREADAKQGTGEFLRFGAERGSDGAGPATGLWTARPQNTVAPVRRETAEETSERHEEALRFLLEFLKQLNEKV